MNSINGEPEKALHYERLMDELPELIWFKDINGIYLACNNQFAAFFCVTKKQVIGHVDNEFISEELAVIFSASDRSILDMSKEGVNEKLALPVTQGNETILDCNKIPIISKTDGKMQGLLGIALNITQSKQAHQEKQISQLTAKIFDITQEGVMITDSEGYIIESNSAFTDITGYEHDEVLGKKTKLLKSGKHDDRFYKALWTSLKENGNWSGEIWDKRKDDVIYPAWENIFTITAPDGEITNFVALFADLTLLKKSQQKLDHMAYHDSLTDLPNRMLLQERLDQAIHYASRHHNHFTVVFIDLDNFKNINDSFGHHKGDELLQSVALNLLETVRQEDTVARIGGDEFVLLLEELADIEYVEIIAQKVLLALQQSISMDARSLNISASLGICLYPQDGSTVDELLRNADTAMYCAKNEGRNNYQFYNKGLNYNASMRNQLENDLHHALSNNELDLYFQPQIDLTSQKLIGVEALIRWQHPKLGQILPSNFIATAEKSGLIHPIGIWVLEKACCQAMQWLEKGVDIGRIAVNVSGLQLQRSDFVEQVQQALNNSGLPAAKLALEVAEEVIDEHIDLLEIQMQTLVDYGIALVIDNFGTGSSLSYLQHLPIYKLKIDKSFIRDIPIDAHDRAITRTAIALGNSLGIQVIAEGVENNEQEKYLLKEGCLEAQGTLYSRPVSAKELEQYFRSMPML